MRRRHLVVVVALLPFVGCGDDGWARAACEPARPHDAGASTITLTSGGIERSAALYVPDGYDGTEEAPLVLSWHGYSSNAVDHLQYADLRPVADDDDVIVVLPQALGEPTRFNMEVGITGETDDVAFAVDLLDRVIADLCVDESRVYSVGSSNGAGMTALLACRVPERFAAIAMVNLVIHYEPCAGPTPAVLGMMGNHDLVVPIQGGRVNCCDGWPIAPADETMERWRSQAGCGEPDEEGIEDHVTRTRWRDCAGDVEVEWYEIDEHGHTWPGARENPAMGPTNQEIDASEVVWGFFRRFTREPA